MTNPHRLIGIGALLPGASGAAPCADRAFDGVAAFLAACRVALLQANAPTRIQWLGPAQDDIHHHSAMRALTSLGVRAAPCPDRADWSPWDDSLLRDGSWSQDAGGSAGSWLALAGRFAGQWARHAALQACGGNLIALLVYDDGCCPRALYRGLARGAYAMVIGRMETLDRLADEMGLPWRQWSAVGALELLAFDLSNGEVLGSDRRLIPVGERGLRIDKKSTLRTVWRAAGRFLALRLLGLDFNRALTDIAEAACAIPQTVGACAKAFQKCRAVRSQPLAACLGEAQRIRDELCWSPPPVVVSGGQTGIDQLALAVAGELGISAHGVLPAGFRTESGPLFDHPAKPPPDARWFALEHSGYRARTWATAFIGDATLILATHRSEGTRATERACRGLDRPFLTVVPKPDALPDIAAFLKTHRPLCLNLAGHRESLLSPEEKRHSSHLIRDVLRLWAGQWGAFAAPRAVSTERPAGASKTDPPIQIAIPNSGPMSRFIRDRLGLETTAQSRNRVSFSLQNGSTLWLGRARDFADWLARGSVDAAIAGLDELTEAGAEGELIFDFGLFRSTIALIGKVGQGPIAASDAIVSQIPNLARDRLRAHGFTNPVQPIHGAAESWLGLGLAPFCVDTWHTGKTARANGLEPLLALGRTSLCCLAAKGLDIEKRSALQRLLAAVAGV